MSDMKKLPDSELEIMMIIWDAKEKVTSDYIMDRINKDWLKTTVLNFLTRLCDRGFLKCHKEGRFNIYESQVDKEDYLQRESKSFLKKMHHNSITSLIATLYDGNSISKDDLEELKKFIGEAE
jgi:BlaI family penicillinase repressor